MPQIPTVVAPTATNVPMISPKMIGMLPAEEIKAGEQLSEIGRILQKAQDNVEAMKLKHSVKADIDAKVDDYNTWTDYNTIDEDAQTFLNSIEMKYQEQLKDNPRLGPVFQTYFEGKKNEFNHLVRMKKTDLIGLEGKYQWQVAFDKTARIIGENETPDKSEALGEIFDNYLAGGKIPDEIKDFPELTTFLAETEVLIGSGVLPKIATYKALEGFIKQSEEAEIINGIKSDDPQAIEETIKKIDDNQFKHLGPKKLSHYRMSGEKWLDIVNTRREKELNRQMVTGTFLTLKERHTQRGETDFDAIFRDLSNPDFQRESGLTLDQIGQIETEIDREERHYKEEGKNRSDETQIKNFGLELNNQLTTIQVEEQVRTHQLSPAQGRATIHRLTTGGKFKTDPVYGRYILDKILSGEDSRDDLVWASGEGRKLNLPDNHILFQLQTEKDKQGKDHFTNDQWFKYTEKQFKSAFATQAERTREAIAGGGVLEVLFGETLRKTAKEKNDEGYFQAMEQLIREVQKGYSEGPNKGRPLKGKDIWQRGQEILEIFAIQKIGDLTTGMPKETIGQPLPKESAPEITATNPNTGEKLILRDGKWIPLK